MRRRTITAATASFGFAAAFAFANLDHGVAMAQETGFVLPPVSADEPLTTETVPEFVSREVVQPLPEEPAEPELAADTAQEQNAQEQGFRSLAELVAHADTSTPLDKEMRCLAGAVYFESRGEPLSGQLAVAEVIINRKASPRFPGSYCGVVYQRSQFSFVKGGTMPRIRENTAAWRQAVAIAQIAHHDHWDSEAEDALFFHATYVKPGWAKRRIAAATINRHIFYR